ncbi:MAG TPA: sugar-binding domain-containing protein [Ktedonobacteraceae bacterium]|nr:sugar-binding domain-containing protein [Ktedonobacteraceae bacterium]
MADITQGNSSEARLLANEQFLRKIAYMYYEDGHSQETIADIESCSRQTVSKALQKAKDRGIVRISIVPDLRTGYLHNLSREVRRELNLEDLVLVPGHNFENVGTNETLDEVVAEIAKAAADYLDQLLTDSDILAVSGGRIFMRNVVRYLKPARPLPQLQVVSTIGFVEPRTSFGDANLVAYDIAQAYCASHTWYPIPALIRENIPGVSPEALIEENSRLSVTEQAVELCEKANVVIMGLWPPHTNDEVVLRGILSRKQIALIEAFHPAVDINHWFFDADGRCINEMMDPPPYYLTGLAIPRLKEKIRAEGTKVILVAGAGPSYVPAIRAALRAGIANILITDHITAELLLSAE